MANDIGWGKAFDPETGWGMAAVNNGDTGYGYVVINSYSGETNISSRDADNIPPDEEIMILDDAPLIYMDSADGFIPVMYLSFRLAEGVESRDINADFYVDGSLSFNIPVVAGINQIWEFPPNGEYYAILNVNLDGQVYSFQSNILTV